MDDLIRRQEAMNAFAERVKRSNNSDFAPVPRWNDAVEIVENLPSADAVEVVRCNDCKHWMPYDWMFSEVWRSVSMDDYSDDEIGCAYCDMNMHANDFCSRAERRTDETD